MKYLGSVAEIFQMARKLQRKYDFLKYEVIGKSLCKREIIGLKIGNTEKMLLFACAFHGMEWMTSLIILNFLDVLCGYIHNDGRMFGINVNECIKKRGLYVVPCVNPDGIEISLKGSEAAYQFKDTVDKISSGNTFDWQANARGVDINHNFDADWIKLHELEKISGIRGPSKTRYGGKYPESEPETRVITNLCRKFNFDYAVAFHSQGEEIYWKYGKNVPKNSKKLADIFALSSGYTLSKPEGLACGGGFKDWFITEFDKPGFTVEIGKGKNPLSLWNLNNIYDKIEKMLFTMALI